MERGFKTVGDLIMHHRQKAALSEAMRLVGEANRYIAETEPSSSRAKTSKSVYALFCSCWPRLWLT